MEQPRIIGIGGTNGSGKDTLAEYLVDEYGYLFVSTSDMLREVAMERDGDLSRPTLYKIGNELRAEYGPGVLVELSINKYKASGNTVGLVCSSLRTKGEIDQLHKEGGVLLFLDADQKLRYQRITTGRLRDDDKISFERFQEQEQAEWHQSDDPGEFSIRSVKESADFSFMNTGDVLAFYANVVTALKLQKPERL